MFAPSGGQSSVFIANNKTSVIISNKKKLMTVIIMMEFRRTLGRRLVQIQNKTFFFLTILEIKNSTYQIVVKIIKYYLSIASGS